MADTKISDLPIATSFLGSQDFAVADSGTSRRLTGDQLSGAWGLDLLGSATLTVAAASTGVVTLTWPPDSGTAATHTKLWIDVTVVGFNVADIAALRFNADSGANYWTRFVYFSAGAWNDVPTIDTTMLRLGETPTILPSNVMVTANNIAAESKVCLIQKQGGTESASITGAPNVCGGEWVSTAARITTVQLVTVDGNNLLAGSGFTVMGV